MIEVFKVIFFSFLGLQQVFAQGGINLGSFGLGKSPLGDLLLNFGQGGNLFGLGADRAMNLNIGPGRLGAKSDGGVSVGGQRLGLENLFGIQEGQGLNLGSFLNTGNPIPLGSQNTANAGGDPFSKLLSSFMGAVPPRPPTTDKESVGVPNGQGSFGGLSKGNVRQPWETDGEDETESSWPTPPTPPDGELGLAGMEKMDKNVGTEDETTEHGITEAPTFPTLINMWTNQPVNPKIPNGFTPSGGIAQVVELPGEVVPVEVGQVGQVTPNGKRINTEGWSGQSVTGTARREGLNSGEASKKSNGKRRGGPPPPAGMIDIDSKEEELRRIRMRT